MKKRKIILTNWNPEDPVVYSSDLGWQKSACLDAGTYNPKEVLEYFCKYAFSIIFYSVIDDSFYELFMESEPYKLWKIKEKSDWNHKWISERISWNEHEEGEVLFTFDDTTDLWNDIKINNLSLGEILKQSIIAEINY